MSEDLGLACEISYISRLLVEEESALNILRQELAGKGVELDAYEGRRGIHLSKIVILKSFRGQGLGTYAMKRLTDYADQTGQQITLTPSTDFGASSVKRLIAFYKRFGFVLNKGRHKDFRISELMYRDPK